MQPSEDEIQREVEALRDIKRRSTAQGGPGALILDPDLPTQTAPPSPQSGYWSPGSASVDDSSNNSHESTSDGSSSGDDPFHLFWVPASLHPEIAPDQFRAFLKEHARSPVDANGTLSRSNSASSTSLGRKQSMLSRQYKPSPNDGVEEEEEKVVPLRRDRSSYYANSGPQLTISDLQKLEELAEEASQSDDPSKLRSVLRRSLSLNVAPSVIDQMDDMPTMGDEADAPIIVPPPGQILRRTARTKIRKSGMTGEGSHRFTTRSRRKSLQAGSPIAAPGDPRSSSDLSSNDHGDLDSLTRPRRLTNEIYDAASHRPESYSEESSIFDAYVTEEPEGEPEPPVVVTSPPPAIDSSIVVQPKAAEPEPVQHEAMAPVLHHPQPKRLLVPPQSPESPVSSRTPSPELLLPAAEATSPLSRRSESLPLPLLSTSPSPTQIRTGSPTSQRKEKDDKGLFGKWGGSEKGNKKLVKDKDKERENREREQEKQKEKEKKGGFFGSLFGTKKKQDENPATSLGHGSGREAAAALLGASKSSKSPAPSPSPQLAGSYARYPIHVERAIYRLSHIKLANPRRPLYEQVLISNLMFWYLGVINKTQTQAAAAQSQTQAPAAGQDQQPVSPPDKDKIEQEQREREPEEREKAEREREEKERAEKEMMERNEQLKAQQQQQQPRRGSLTKAASPGTPGGRRPEMPVRGPQYEMQHRAMEQEYVGQPGPGPGPAPVGRGSPVPAGGGSLGGYSGHGQAPYPYSPSQSAPPQPQIPNNFYYDSSTDPEVQHQHRMTSPHRSTSPQLPLGAMPPVSMDQSWLNSQTPSMSRSATSPSSPRGPSTSPPSSPGHQNVRQSRSPPPHNRYSPVHENHIIDSGGMKPTRSLSAAAAAPPVLNTNGKLKKISSAHAAPSNKHRPRTTDGTGGGGEEDVPLALYQQQQRRR